MGLGTNTGKEYFFMKFITDAELRALPDVPKVVRRDGKGNIDLCWKKPNGDYWGYWITEKTIKTRRGLIRMIRHLCEKKWITPQHIIELIDISFKLVSEDI